MQIKHNNSKNQINIGDILACEDGTYLVVQDNTSIILVSLDTCSVICKYESLKELNEHATIKNFGLITADKAVLILN